MPTDGVLKVAKEMGFSGQYVIIFGVKDKIKGYGFIAYDTNNKIEVKNFFQTGDRQTDRYIQSKLDAFKRYAKSDYAYRF